MEKKSNYRTGLNNFFLLFFVIKAYAILCCQLPEKVSNIALKLQNMDHSTGLQLKSGIENHTTQSFKRKNYSHKLLENTGRYSLETISCLFALLRASATGKFGSKCHRKSLLSSIVWLLGPHQIVWIVSRNSKTIQRIIRQTTYSKVKRQHTHVC